MYAAMKDYRGMIRDNGFFENQNVCQQVFIWNKIFLNRS